MKRIDKQEIYTSFGQRMVERRNALGMSQSEVAVKLDVSQSYYCYIETGRRAIDLTLAMNICKVLGIDFNAFISDYLTPIRKRNSTRR